MFGKKQAELAEVLGIENQILAGRIAEADGRAFCLEGANEALKAALDKKTQSLQRTEEILRGAECQITRTQARAYKAEKALKGDAEALQKAVEEAVQKVSRSGYVVASHDIRREDDDSVAVRLTVSTDQKPPKNPNRTEEGLHICEKCGVVYRTVEQTTMQTVLKSNRAGINIWSTTGMYFDEALPAAKSDSDLLLKSVNSDRFCFACEEDLQETLDTLHYLTELETVDSGISTAFRRGVYEARKAKKDREAKEV
jgi:hypothetical protein